MMAKRFNYLPWLIGGAAIWFLFRKPGTIQGIGGYKKGVQEKINEYILHNVKPINNERILTNDKERIQYVMDVFRKEYGWNIDSIGNYNAFIEWIEGYPDIIDISYPKYGNVIKDAINIGLIKENDSDNKKNKLIKNWNVFIAKNILKLAKKYNVYFPKRG